MEPNPQPTLEELIQRELAKLPEHQAPEGLIPLVMARIQARERKHWWQRPWSKWPVAVQLASLPVLLGGAGGAVFAFTVLGNFFFAHADYAALTESLGTLSAVWDVFSALGNAVLIVGRIIGQQWLLLALFVPLTMYLTCVGVGTLCFRMAFCNRSPAHE